MAEPVFIEGFSDDVLNNLPEWAKDETLERIFSILRKTLKVEEDGFKKLEAALRQFSTGKTSPNDVPDADKIGKYNKGVDGLLDNVERETNQNKKTKKFDDEENKRRTLGAKIFGGLTKKALVFDATLLALDYTAAKAIQMMAANTQVFTNLYNAGINVVDTSAEAVDGFQSLANMSMLAGIRIGTLEKIYKDHAQVVAAIGSNKLIKATEKAQKGLSAFGFSASESLVFTAEYLDSVKGFTDIQTLSTAQVATSVTKFAGTMKNLSLTTGQSTTEIMTKFKDLAKSTDAFVLSSQIGADASTDLLGVLSSLSDESIRKEILATMVEPIKELDRTVTTLRASGNDLVAQNYIDMTQRVKAAGNEKERIAIIKSFGENLGLTDAEMVQLKTNTHSQNSANAQASQATLDIVTKYQQLSRTMVELTDEEQASIDKAHRSAEARKRIDDAFNKIMTHFGAIFAPFDEILNFVGASLEVIGDVTGWIAEQLKGTWFGPLTVALGIIVAIGGKLMLLGKILGSAFTNVGASLGRFGLALVKLPLTIAKLPFTILGSLGSWLKGSLVNLFSGIDIKGLFSNLFKGISNIFSKGSGIFGRVFSWLGRILGSFGSILGKIAGWFGNLINPIAKLASAFALGWSIGTILHNFLEDFTWFQDGMDALFGWLDHILQYIPGQIGKDAKERIETKEKVKAMEEESAKKASAKVEPAVEAKIADKKAEAIAAKPTVVEKRDLAIYDPKPTSVNSVSGDSAEPAPASTGTDATAADVESIAKAAPVAKEPEINSILKYQTSLLEQQLDKITNLLATNRDQLKIVRNAS